MRKKIKYYLIRCLAVLTLAGLVYASLKQIKTDTLTFTMILRCIKNTPIGLEYESEGKKEIKKLGQFLNASQISVQVQFDITDFEHLKDLKIYLGDTVNTIFLEGFSILKRHLSRQEYIYSWTAVDSTEKIVQDLSNCKIGDKSTRYIQIETRNGPNYIEINQKAFEGRLIKYKSIYSTFKYAVCSIIISLFICFSYWFWSKPPIVRIYRWKDFKINSVSVLIIFILFFIFSNSIYPFIPDLKNFENRNLSPKPSLSLDNIFQYPELLTKYVQDHFAFRSYLVYINSFIHMKLFNVSSVPNLVLIGKQGWLYISDNGTLNDYRRMSKIDTSIGTMIISNFNQRMEWLKKLNCKFYLFCPPNKDRIYPEYMPSKYATKGMGYNSYEYYKSLFEKGSNIDFIDPTDSLLSGKKKRVVYLSNDTHWNQYGGFKGYQALMGEIKKSFPELTIIQENDLTITEYSNSSGDLTVPLGLPDMFYNKGYFLNLKDTSMKLNNTVYRSALLSFHNNKTLNGSKLKLLMFMDSYSNFLIPLLNMHFDESVYIRTTYFMTDIIEKEHPDIVIFESLERILSQSLTIPNPQKINMGSN